jgi:hypothetical protein
MNTNVERTLIDFSPLIMGYHVWLNRFEDTKLLISPQDGFFPIVILLIPFCVLCCRPLQRFIAHRPTLFSFWEPFMTTWFFAAVFFQAWFYLTLVSHDVSMNKPAFQSPASFAVMFFLVGTIIYPKKGFQILFFRA